MRIFALLVTGLTLCMAMAGITPAPTPAPGAAPLFTSAPPANGTVDVPYTHTFTTNVTPTPTPVPPPPPPTLRRYTRTIPLQGTPTPVPTSVSTPPPLPTPRPTPGPNSPFFRSAPPANGTVDVPYTHTFTNNGTPPPTLTVTAGTLPAGLSLAGTTLAGTPTAPGVFPGITVTASNGLAPNATQTFSLTIADTFEHFMAALGIIGADAIASADPDHDGILNIAEYGLHLLPNVPTLIGQPVAQKKSYAGTEYLSMTFTRLTTATDLTYIVQASADFATWTDVATSVGGVTTGPGFVGETGTAPALTVEVRDIVAYDNITAPNRFMRLRIFKTGNP